jgi:hypothetical protein
MAGFGDGSRIMDCKFIFAAAGLSGLLLSTPAFADDTGLAYAHDLRKERGRLCMSDHYHSGSGTGRTKAAARAAAVRAWIDFTNFEYGTAWARFSLAANTTTHYTKEAVGWSADVDGRPCRG